MISPDDPEEVNRLLERLKELRTLRTVLVIELRRRQSPETRKKYVEDLAQVKASILEIEENLPNFDPTF